MKEILLSITETGKIDGTKNLSLMQYEHRITRIAIDISSFVDGFHQDVKCASISTTINGEKNYGVVGAIPDEAGMIYWEPSAADTRKSGSMNFFVMVMFEQGREARSEMAKITINPTQEAGSLAVSLGAQAAMAGMCEVRFTSLDGGNLEAWVDKNDKRVCHMDFFNHREKRHWSGYVQIKPQGTSSMAYPKKNFTIELFDDKQKSNSVKALFIKDWNAQGKYCMKANWIDKTHACNVVSARLARDMMEGYPANAAAPCHGLIDGYPTLAWFDHDCTGLYTMNIPKDAWQFGMDEANPNHIVMCAEEQLTECAFRAEATPSGWSVEVGGDDSTTIFQKFNEMVSFVRNTEEEAFRTGFSQHLDLDACLNYYCFVYLVGATDNLGKNMLMTTRDGVIWAPSLYDLDSLFGVQWDGIRPFPSDGPCPTAYQCNSSLLWSKLEEYFVVELCERYFELRKGALSLNMITKKWTDFVDSIPESLYQYDARRWWGIRAMHRTYDQTINWITERATYVDNIFNAKYKIAIGAPEMVARYDDFISNGDNYLDTEQRLFTGDYDSCTIFARIKPGVDGSVFFSAFSERYPDPGYRGILCRQVADKLYVNVLGDTASIGAAYGEGINISEVVNADGSIDVAVVKKLDTYYLYVAGNRVAVGTVDVPSTIDETLLIGAQWDGSGMVFRQSQVEVPVFELWRGFMTAADIVQHFAEI